MLTEDEETIQRRGHQDGHIPTGFTFMDNRFHCSGVSLLLVVFAAGVDTALVQ